MNHADKEAIWNAMRLDLAEAWAAYEQLHGIPASAWPDQERALFDLALACIGNITGDSPQPWSMELPAPAWWITWGSTPKNGVSLSSSRILRPTSSGNCDSGVVKIDRL